MRLENLPPKKSLGQNFLTNPHVVQKIVDTANLKEGDTVLEIGPGTGTLTEGLLKTGATVIALEADDRAIPLLQEKFKKEIASGLFNIHHVDVRDTAVHTYIPKAIPKYCIVANIPYYLSGMLLRTTLSAEKQPTQIVFLVQKEVAERIARSEKESLLSLSVKAYGTPHYIQTVPRGNFIPVPNVDSAILSIENISRDHFNTIDDSWFFSVLKAGFSARRKQLLGNLQVLCPRKTLVEVFEILHINLTARGEDLPIETWISIAEKLKTQCPH